MRIEFLWYRDCPSWEEALADLEEEMRAHGLDRELLEVREVATEADAEALGFPGSPTIRIDGRDIIDPDEQPQGLNCRIYRLRDGRVSAIPDRADLAAALDTVSGGESDER